MAIHSILAESPRENPLREIATAAFAVTVDCERLSHVLNVINDLADEDGILNERDALNRILTFTHLAQGLVKQIAGSADLIADSEVKLRT